MQSTFKSYVLPVFKGIHEILRCWWEYSIELDVGHKQGTSYMGVWVKFCTTSGKLPNVHVVAIPLHDSKTEETQFNVCSKDLEIVDPVWR